MPPRLSYLRSVAVNAAAIGAALGEMEPMDWKTGFKRGDERVAFVWYADDIATLAQALTDEEEKARKKHGTTLYNEGWDDYESVCVSLARVARDRGEMELKEARKWVKNALIPNSKSAMT